MSGAPQTADAYTRVALRLRALANADREWLLSRLTAEDCRRVSTALQRCREAPGPALNGSEVTAPTAGAPLRAEAAGARPAAVAEPEDSALARLKSSRPADVKHALAAQPDWVVALVLSAHPWPWIPEFLGSLGPERTRAVRSLQHELTALVKPRFVAQVLRAFAARLEPPHGVALAAPAFDTALEQALAELTPVMSARREGA